MRLYFAAPAIFHGSMRGIRRDKHGCYYFVDHAGDPIWPNTPMWLDLLEEATVDSFANVERMIEKEKQEQAGQDDPKV